MNLKRVVLLLALVFPAILLPLLPQSATTAGAVPVGEESNENVDVGIYLLSLGSFDLTKGTYVADFYLILRWNDTNISPLNFEFMNGRATSKDKIYENTDNGSSEVWYRIQANLYMTPEFSNYPFDEQILSILVEDSKNNISTISYRVYSNVNGMSDRISVPGWRVECGNIRVETVEYPWGEKYSRFVFSVKLSRDAGATAGKLMLPPIIFCIVSGLSFFFKADKITHRIGLGTSTLISAVMFHLSQTTSLPPLPTLILIDKIMISVYVFLASSLLATTLIYIDEEFWKDVDYTKYVNRYGAIVTLISPFIVFAILYFLI
ncbi:MAG: hypothetical protein ACP5JR_00965 [Thermoplasmata archaeon]